MRVLETGGLRIMHWGDKSIDPNPQVWDMLGSVDIALLPIDASMHILSYEQADEIADKLNATVIVPHHYFMWDLVQRGSTLLPADAYVATREHIKTDGPDDAVNTDLLGQWKRKVVHFGENVAFEKPPLADAKSTSQDWG